MKEFIGSFGPAAMQRGLRLAAIGLLMGLLGAAHGEAAARRPSSR